VILYQGKPSGVPIANNLKNGLSFGRARLKPLSRSVRSRGLKARRVYQDLSLGAIERLIQICVRACL
jgi:hypothetical protein